MSFKKIGSEFTMRTNDEIRDGENIKSILKSSIDAIGSKWDIHLPLFLTPASLARILWLNDVYLLSIDVPGKFVEFGSQWGGSLNVFALLRLIHEPWNVSREILSFSTFSDGFVSVDNKDGMQVNYGDYGVSKGWKENLEFILNSHTAKSPVESKVKIVEGDVCETFPQWLDDNPEAIISHAHFDLDIYKPTHDVLQVILNRMPSGSVLIFDELNCPSFPGETIAVQEVLGIKGLKLRKSKYQPYSAYCVID